MNKRIYPAVNIGSASMLLVFIILSLITLSVLSLSSAVSDYNYSQKIADRNTEYYAACNHAEQILSDIDHILADTWNHNYSAYDNEVVKSLSAVAGVETGALATEHIAEYTVEMNETSALKVELYIYPANAVDDQFYEITDWSVISTKKWSGDQPLNLMEGE